MTKEKLLTLVFIPLLCAGIGLLGGSKYESDQNSEINISIINALNNGADGIPSDANLKTSASYIIEAYNDAKQENQSQMQQIGILQNDYRQMQKDLETLQTENEHLSQENDKLKAFLLHDNTYAEDIDDLVIVKETLDRLERLSVNDSMGYTLVDNIKDYHGNYHSISHKLHARDTAFVEYKLATKYDVLNANIATTLETGPDVHFNVEVYVDDNDQPIKRLDNITRDSNLIPLGPIVVTDIDRLRIKVIKMEGPSYSNAICYITDDTLSVVQ